MTPNRTALVISLTAALLLSGCGRSVYYVTPREWRTPVQRDSLIQSFRPYLEGRRIFLDPGHGGVDRFGRGPEGDAIEADVNLRVGLALRSLLTAAGARVFMSRERDTSIDLADRPLLALSTGAEIFVSLHHNATGTGDDITNYSSVYYHSRDGHPDYHPANHDLARYIERDMSYAMRNAAPPFSPTFDGTLSDFDIYPNSGFAVLRGNTLPAVLVEASFFSHPHEERRLTADEFNRIEAWGIFLGLGKYFRSGVPQVALLSDTLTHDAAPTLQVALSPWYSIDRNSLSLSIDGNPAIGQFSDSLQSVLVSPSIPLTSGYHRIDITVRNAAGNWNWPFRQKILAMLPAAALFVTAHPAELLPDSRTFSRITLALHDSAGMPVADGMTARLAETAWETDSTTATAGGRAVFYVQARVNDPTLRLTASADSLSTRFELPVRTSGKAYFGGDIRSGGDSSLLAGVIVSLADSSGQPARLEQDTTALDGKFCLLDSVRTGTSVFLRRRGYHARLIPAETTSVQLLGDLFLEPVAGGRIHGRTICLDPRYGGSENGETDTTGRRAADCNLEIAMRLARLLDAAGADVFLTRTNDTTISEGNRAKMTARLPRGLFLRIDASQSPSGTSCEIFGNRPNQLTSRALLSGLAIVTGLDTTGTVTSSQRFYRDVAMATITVRLPSPGSGYYAQQPDAAADRLAWGLFLGLLLREGFQPDSARRYQVLTARAPDPVPGRQVILDRTLPQLTHPDGTVRFWGLERPGSLLELPGQKDVNLVPFPLEKTP